MECLNCGAPVLENGHCSECGMNYQLLAKAYNTSNYYYNLGLDRASVRDLTGAVDALNLALKYNKQNINARNLLGLIHYEMGETVLGLTQWVISNNYYPGEENIAGEYIKEVQADTQRLEEANQLAKQFNQALGHAKHGTKDLAFIQLKRILSSYPHFVKGYLLLALLYMDNGNPDKAKKALKRVLRIDKNNTLAVKYLAEMGVAPRDIIGMKESSVRIDVDSAYSDEDQFKSDLETFVQKGLADIDNPDLSVGSYKEINHNKFNLVYVSVGLIVGILAFWLLILPTKLNSANQQNRKQQLDYSEEISKKNVTISDLESRISDLEEQIAEAEEKSSEDAQEEKDSKEAFQIIKNSMPNTAYETLCTEAAKAIEARMYTKAIDMCNVALQIQEGEEAYYCLGRAYAGNQDEEKAKSAFTTLKDNYPESSHIEEISDYLSE
ncbi:MAG: tetratricopeptide repeat protein [Bacteroidales bacterium]|nr:tetratricopeptide repeat protein [Clostridium sp.]MCM1204102.1 tetratricopeptide repeat protein [Bacteroidales bacterium]